MIELRATPQEKIQGNPAWMTLECLGTTESEGVTLHEYNLALNLEGFKLEETKQHLKEQFGIELDISQEDVEFLQQYNIEFKIWSEDPLKDWYETMKNTNTCVALLGEGLASNHQQWTNPGCSFVHRWHGHFEQNIRPQCATGNGQLKLISMAISCPGFGGLTSIKEDEISPEDVSDAAYARLLDAATRLLHIPVDNSVAGAHSAGGEAMLKWFLSPERKTNIPIVAFHPSIALSRQTIFDLIKTLDKAKGLLPQALSGAAENRLLRWLIGFPLTGKLTKPQQTQLEMHRNEMQNHPAAFAAKLQELAQKDSLELEKRKITTTSGMPRLLVSSEDVLARIEGVDEWFAEYLNFAREQLAQFGLFIEKPELDIEQSLVAYMKAEKDWGHDAIFTNLRAQDAAIQMLGSQLEWQLSPRWPVLVEAAEIIIYLKSKGFPVTFHLRPARVDFEDIRIANAAYVKASETPEDLQKYTSGDNISVRSRLEQAETLCQWAEAQQLLAEWEKMLDKWQVSDDVSRVAIPEKERETLLGLVLNTHGNKTYFERKGIDPQSLLKMSPAHLINIFHGDRENRIPSNYSPNWMADVNLIYFLKSGLSDLLVKILVEPTTAKGGIQEAIERIKEAKLLENIEEMKAKRQVPVGITITIEDLLILQKLASMLF